MSITSAILPIQAKTGRRQWLRGLLAIFLLLIGGFVGTWCVLENASARAWDVAVAEAEALDPRWRLENILAERVEIADAENSAATILAVGDAVQKASLGGMPDYMEFFEKQAPPPPALWDAPRLAYLRSELAKLPQALDDARRLKDFPKGRFQFPYQENYWHTNPIEAQQCRRVGALLQHDIYLRVQDGEYDKAIESCLALMNAGEAMCHEPIWLAFSTRRAVYDDAIELLERVLAQGEVSEESLVAVQARLHLQMKEDTWPQVIRAMKAGDHQVHERIRSGQLKASTNMNSRAPGPQAAFDRWYVDVFPSAALKHYPAQLKQMNRLHEIGKLPLHEQRKRIDEWASASPHSPGLSSTFAKLIRGECRRQAWVRSAYVAIACERYRMTHQYWPDALDVLVKEKLLNVIPADPFDNQPLRYRKTADGIVIYSIGADETDDGGRIDRTNRGPNTDEGFRLWNLKSRRQPPVATPAGFPIEE